MLRKWFLVPVLGSLAVLFVAVDVAQAQLRGNKAGILNRLSAAWCPCLRPLRCGMGHPSHQWGCEQQRHERSRTVD